MIAVNPIDKYKTKNVFSDVGKPLSHEVECINQKIIGKAYSPTSYNGFYTAKHLQDKDQG